MSGVIRRSRDSVMEAYKTDIDRTSIPENLKLAGDE
jgi:hypothetical protein